MADPGGDPLAPAPYVILRANSLIGQQQFKVADFFLLGARTLTDLGPVASLDLVLAVAANRGNLNRPDQGLGFERRDDLAASASRRR